jgi:uncharacterized protein YwgA
MKRGEVVLAALAPGGGAPHSPVQVQKILFLIDRNIAKDLGWPRFDFQPYNYGPFDKAVYEELQALAKDGLVELCSGWKWTEYRLTEAGQEAGEKVLLSLKANTRGYIEKISGVVRSLTFTQLVSAIYKAYPEMRTNSVFQD